MANSRSFVEREPAKFDQALTLMLGGNGPSIVSRYLGFPIRTAEYHLRKVRLALKKAGLADILCGCGRSMSHCGNCNYRLDHNPGGETFRAMAAEHAAKARAARLAKRHKT